MRSIRTLALLVAASLLSATLAPPASASGVKFRTYGGGVVGGNAFGVNSFGVNSFGVNTFGVNTFGVNTFGVNAFGVNSFGVNAFGVNPFGVTPFGVVPSGVVPFSVSPFGVETFNVAPSAFTVTPFAFTSAHGGRTFRAQTYFFTPALVQPGRTAPGGSSGSELADDIKQIKARLKSLEDDVKGIKDRVDRLDPVKVKPPLFDEKAVEAEIKKVHERYQKYFAALDEFHTKQESLRKEIEKALDALTAAPKDPVKRKAYADLVQAYERLTPPVHPTMNGTTPKGGKNGG